MTVEDAVRARSASIERDAPEWRAYLARLEHALAEASSGRFDALRVERGPRGASDASPFLLGATIALPRRPTQRWLAATLPPAVVRSREVDPLDVLRASIAQDAARLEAIAVVVGEDAPALQAAASLAALPVLFACRRAAGTHPGTWDRGFCPVCAAWPVLSESRGLERRRRLRCGRCGADGDFPWLRCPYCGTSDHRRQGSLVPEAGGESRRAETCEVCRGYVKTLATVSALAPEMVPLEDLGSVAFDLVAVERGFRRPTAPGCDLACAVTLA